MPNIVTCFPLTTQQAEQMQQVAGRDYQLLVSSQEDIHQNIMQADIFCGHAKDRLDWQSVVDQGRLKWIQSTAAGLDHCLVPAVIKSSVTVSGCSALFAPQVAEQTMALLSSLIRSMPTFFRAQQKREYVRRATDNLFNKSIGILGLGGNGRQIARVLRPMVRKILGTDLFVDDCRKSLEPGLVDEILAADQLNYVLLASDIVIVTLPLTESNEGLIGAKEFSQMKDKSYLINVGRGSVVNSEALVSAAKSGKLSGVGIDVVDPEPLPAESELWALENVVITPHVGAQSPLRVPITVDFFCENLNRFRKGEQLLNQVDKELGLPRPETRVTCSLANATPRIRDTWAAFRHP